MEIIDAYLQAGQCSLPSLKQRVTSRKSVPGWSNYVAEKRNKSLFWHNIWKENNSPSDGLISEIRRTTRKDYHKAVKFVKNNKMEVIAEKTISIIIRREI